MEEKWTLVKQHGEIPVKKRDTDFFLSYKMF